MARFLAVAVSRGRWSRWLELRVGAVLRAPGFRLGLLSLLKRSRLPRRLRPPGGGDAALRLGGMFPKRGQVIQ